MVYEKYQYLELNQLTLRDGGEALKRFGDGISGCFRDGTFDDFARSILR